MKALKFFFTIILVSIINAFTFAEEINLNLGSLTSSQDSIYGTVYDVNFALPTELDSLSDIMFAEINLSSDIILADSNEVYQTELVPLNPDNSLNFDFASSHILSLKMNGKTYFDITPLIREWLSGNLAKNGFIIRKKHSDVTEPSASFVTFSSGNFAKLRILYSP